MPGGTILPAKWSEMSENDDLTYAPSGRMGRVEPVEITAGRLHLRPFAAQDVPAVARACQDPDIQHYTQVPSPYDEEEARRYVEVYCPSGWATGRRATFAVVDSTTAELLASVGLNGIGIRDEGMAEIGYWCAPWARRRGVMTQAVTVVCRWGFAMFDLARIEWYAEVGNVASRAVAERAGFTIEGVLRARLTHRGQRVDAWVGSLLRAEAT